MYPELSVFKESGYLEAIVKTSDDGILVVDAEGRFEFGNTSFFRIFGWKPEELVGETFFKVIPEDLVAFMTARWEEVQRGEGIIISDADHNILYANLYCATALGFDTHDLLQMRTMQHRASAIEGVLSLGPAEAGGVALSCTFANPHRDRQQSPPPNE